MEKHFDGSLESQVNTRVSEEKELSSISNARNVFTHGVRLLEWILNDLLKHYAHGNKLSNFIEIDFLSGTIEKDTLGPTTVACPRVALVACVK